jgi:hypothetical protein
MYPPNKLGNFCAVFYTFERGLDPEKLRVKGRLQVELVFCE